jgi:hypothetical protein
MPVPSVLSRFPSRRGSPSRSVHRQAQRGDSGLQCSARPSRDHLRIPAVLDSTSSSLRSPSIAWREQPSTTTGPWEAGAQPLPDGLNQRRLPSRSTRVTASQPSQAQSRMAASLTAPLQFRCPPLLVLVSPRAGHLLPRTPRSRSLMPWWRRCAIRQDAPPQNEAEVLDPHPPLSLAGESRFRASTCPAGTTRRRTPLSPPPRGAPSFEVSYRSGESVRKYAGTSTWLSMQSSGWAISPPRSCCHTSS